MPNRSLSDSAGTGRASRARRPAYLREVTVDSEPPAAIAIACEPFPRQWHGRRTRGLDHVDVDVIAIWELCLIQSAEEPERLHACLLEISWCALPGVRGSELICLVLPVLPAAKQCEGGDVRMVNCEFPVSAELEAASVHRGADGRVSPTKLLRHPCLAELRVVVLG